MAHIYPGAVWRPQTGQEKRAKRRKGRGVGFHIAVTEAPSIWSINERTGNDAHLYVRRDGGVEQNVDLDLVAYAGRDGNPSMVWVETQGGTTPADVKSGRWSPAQAETLAQIAAYLHRTEGTPLGLMPDARPASRGLATHRLGIKHSQGNVPGWWFAGCELWSSAVGKECPGDARVAQLPEISARAQQIATGDDDMSYPQWTKEDRDFFLADIRDSVLIPTLKSLFPLIADSVWAKQLEMQGYPGKFLSTGDILSASDAITDETRARVDAVGTATASAVAAATRGGDPAVLATALKEALGEQLAADVAARLTVTAS